MDAIKQVSQNPTQPAHDLSSRRATFCLVHLRLRSRFPKLVPEHMVQNEGYAGGGIEQQNGVAAQVIERVKWGELIAAECP